MKRNTKFISVYSVGTDGYGIDNLSKGKRGIYIYPGSHNKLTEIKKGDIIFFIQTSYRRGLLFTFVETIEKNGKKYIVINEKDEFEVDLTIAEFKNLYFLNIDSLRSWVRSPLGYNTNLLIFESGKDILNEFCNFEKLKSEISSNLEYLQREYIFTTNIEQYISESTHKLRGNNFTKVICHINKDNFIKEYSAFSNEGHIPNNKYFGISFDNLKKFYSKQNLRNLDKIISNNLKFIFYTYPSYYDLTRAGSENTGLPYEESDLEKEEEKEEKFITNRGESRTYDMVKYFIDLKNNYKREEYLWLIIGSFSFFFIFLLSLLPIISLYFSNLLPYLFISFILFYLSGIIALVFEIVNKTDRILKEEKKYNKFKLVALFLFKVFRVTIFIFFVVGLGMYIVKNLLDIGNKISFNFKNDFYIFIPLSIINLVFLYFSVYQYSKSKNLRIEFENKIALINGYLGLQDMQEKNIDLFGAKTAEIVFSKAVSDKNDKDLPIDQIASIIKAINGK